MKDFSSGLSPPTSRHPSLPFPYAECTPSLRQKNSRLVRQVSALQLANKLVCFAEAKLIRGHWREKHLAQTAKQRRDHPVAIPPRSLQGNIFTCRRSSQLALRCIVPALANPSQQLFSALYLRLHPNKRVKPNCNSGDRHRQPNQQHKMSEVPVNVRCSNGEKFTTQVSHQEKAPSA